MKRSKAITSERKRRWKTRASDGGNTQLGWLFAQKGGTSMSGQAQRRLSSANFSEERRGLPGRIHEPGRLLHRCVQFDDYEMLKWVLKFDEALGHVDYRINGHTPLMVAAKLGRFDCAKALLWVGASTVTKDATSKLPWTLAREENHKELGDYLENAHGEFTRTEMCRDYCGYMIYKLCKKRSLKEKDLEVLRKLLQQFGVGLVNEANLLDNEPPLIVACKSCNEDAVYCLITEFNADVYVRDMNEQSTLHLAIQAGMGVRFLITDRAPDLLVAPDGLRRLPFFTACLANDWKYVKWLFDKLKAVERPTSASSIQLPEEANFRMPSDGSGEGVPVSDCCIATPPSPVIQRPAPLDADVQARSSESSSLPSESTLLEQIDKQLLKRSHSTDLVEYMEDCRDNHPLIILPLGSATGESSTSSLELTDVDVDVYPSPNTPSLSDSSDNVSQLLHSLGSETELVSFIRSIDICKADVKEETVFHVLARHGYLILLRLLLEQTKAFGFKVSPDVFVQCSSPSSGSYTPLHCAVRNNNPHCTEVMLSEILKAMQTTSNQALMDKLRELRLMDIAVKQEHIPVLKVLVKFGWWYELKDKEMCALSFTGPMEGTLHIMALHAIMNHLRAAATEPNSEAARGSCICWEGMGLPNLDTPLLLPVVHEMLQYGNALLAEHTQGNILERLDDPQFLCDVGAQCLRTVKNTYYQAGASVPPLEAFAGLTHFTQVTLSRNKLKNVPFELFALPNLEILTLSNNQLTYLPTSPSTVNEMEQFQERTTAESAAHRYQCHRLRELYVDNNELHSLPPALFQLSNLETLDASHNGLTYLPLQLWLAPKLKTLRLHHNQLSQLHCLSHEFQINCDMVMDISVYHWCDEVSCRLARLWEEENENRSMQFESSLTSTYVPSPAGSMETGNSAANTPEDRPKRRSWVQLFHPRGKRPHSGGSFSDTQDIMLQGDATGSDIGFPLSPDARSFTEDELYSEGMLPREVASPDSSSSRTLPDFISSLISRNANEKLKEFCQFLHEAGDNLEGIDGAQTHFETDDHSAEDKRFLTSTRGSSGGGLLTMLRQQHRLRTASRSTNREATSPSPLDEEQSNAGGRCDDLPSLPSGERDEEAPRSKPIPPLETLDLAHNHFSTVPWDMTCLAPNLEKINLSNNRISSMNLVKDFPKRVKQINLSNNEIQESMEDRRRKEHCICGHFVMQLLNHLLQQELFNCECEHRLHTSLPQLTKLNLSHNRLPFLPVSSEDLPVNKGRERIEIVFMPSLSILDLSHNTQMACLSSTINKLSMLLQLTLSHTELSSLPTQLGLCPKLLVVDLEGVVNHLPTYLQKAYLPPGGSLEKLLQVLKDIHLNSQPYHCIRLMVVGDVNKGKTTLVVNLSKRFLVRRQKRLRLDQDGRPLSTEGVDILDWEYRKGGKNQTSVTFHTWDFGGQKEYYATHQVFFSKRSLYLLVFDVTDGEEGIYGLKRWLENIEAKASGSPVMVVGTHLDDVPAPQRAETIGRLTSLFEKEYLGQVQETMALRLDPNLRLVNTLDNANVLTVRDAVYDRALSYCPSLSRGGEHERKEEVKKLSEFRVPALYIEMERIVRELAAIYRKDSRVPILNKETFVSAILKGQPHYDEYDVHQGVPFLHDNGILLHFPEANLSDLYFIDPQWLSTVLAKVISIPELRSYHRNGFMKTAALDMIFANDQVLSKQHYQDIINLMQKFEVALILDDKQILIPTLLPTDEHDAQGVYPMCGTDRPNLTDMEDSLVFEGISVAEIASAASWRDTLVRHFIVPFVPNGFFPRLVARIIASGLAVRMANCLAEETLGNHHASNSLHWYCWCHGFTLVWRHTEILRITQVSYNLPGTRSMTLLGDMSREQPTNNCAIEVEVAMLPEDVFCNDNFLQGRESILQKLQPDASESTDEQSMGWQLAAWLLNSVTEHTRSVFEDWYPQFVWGKESRKANVLLADICPSCLVEIRPARLDYQQGKKKKPPAPTMGGNGPPSSILHQKMKNHEERTVCFFALTYSAYASSCGKNLVCQQHGSIPVGSVAPDVEFKDIYYKPVSSYCEVKKTKKLGQGAYGSVYLGTISNKSISLHVAIKELTGAAGPDSMAEEEENQQWSIYQNASTEARIMSELKHKHILGLVGLTLHPWCLLLEYAPQGDLKWHIGRYTTSRLHLGQRVLLQVMTQLASAVDYLHSLNVIYRDLKPSNVLVWKFPKPSEQWKSDANVFVKIADYGISKYGNPWGTSGDAGTPVFQPPEAQINRPGMELFVTNKFDVYSYGIVLYCVYTGKTPFDNYHGPVSSVVNNGVRPDILMKDLPRVQWMFELMCWCWGQKPQHRPPFSEVLAVMKDPLFHRLLLAEEVSTKNQSVTAACFRQTAAPVRLGHRRQASGPFLLDDTESRSSSLPDGAEHIPVTAPSPPPSFDIPRSRQRRISMPAIAASLPMNRSLQHVRASGSDVTKMLSSFHLDKLKPRVEQEEGKSQLWFATANGRLYVKDCIKGTIETVDTVPTMVQTMLVYQDQVWCGFLKHGVRVYHADSHKCIATGADSRTITQLLYNPHLRVVHAFTHEGEILTYGDLGGLLAEAESSNMPVVLSSEGVTVTPLEKKPHFDCAVMVPSENGLTIWCYVQCLRQVFILDPNNLNVKESISVPGKSARKEKTVQPTFRMICVKEEDGKELTSKEEPNSFVLLLDHTRVVKYSAKTCSLVAIMDMQHCLAQDMSAGEGAADYPTSMEMVGRHVYVGSVGGVIRSIDPDEMHVRDEIRPFQSRVSCLLGVKGIGKRSKQGADHVEWRERSGLAPYTLRGLQQSEEYLVAFGEKYRPVYHNSAFKPSRAQLLLPHVVDADELPVSESLLGSSSTLQRSTQGSTDAHCHMIVVDVNSPYHLNDN